MNHGKSYGGDKGYKILKKCVTSFMDDSLLG